MDALLSTGVHVAAAMNYGCRPKLDHYPPRSFKAAPSRGSWRRKGAEKLSSTPPTDPFFDASTAAAHSAASTARAQCAISRQSKGIDTIARAGAR